MLKLPELPEAAYKQAIYTTQAGIGWQGSFSADQMRAYGHACARAALEQAAQVCDQQSDWDDRNTQYCVGVDTCAAAIRALLQDK